MTTNAKQEGRSGLGEERTGAGSRMDYLIRAEERARIKFDILHRTNEALQDERNLAYQALEMARIPVLEAAPQGWIVHTNRLFELLTGLSGEELRGRDLLAVLFPEDDHDRGTEAFQRVLKGGMSGSVPGLIMTKEGEPVSPSLGR